MWNIFGRPLFSQLPPHRSYKRGCCQYPHSESPRARGRRVGGQCWAESQSVFRGGCFPPTPAHTPPLTVHTSLGSGQGGEFGGGEGGVRPSFQILSQPLSQQNESVWTEALGDKPPRRFYFTVPDSLLKLVYDKCLALAAPSQPTGSLCHPGCGVERWPSRRGPGARTGRDGDLQTGQEVPSPCSSSWKNKFFVAERETEREGRTEGARVCACMCVRAHGFCPGS